MDGRTKRLEYLLLGDVSARERKWFILWTNNKVSHPVRNKESSPVAVSVEYAVTVKRDMSKSGRTFIYSENLLFTRVGTLIVATIYLQLIQNRYMFRSSTVLQCSHQHCVQPVASDVEVVGYL